MFFFFFFFFTNSTNSIAHYNKESRFLVLKNGTNSSLAWIEGHHLIDAPFWEGSFYRWNTYVCFVLKKTFFFYPQLFSDSDVLFNVVIYFLNPPYDIRLTNKCFITLQNKREYTFVGNIKSKNKKKKHRTLKISFEKKKSITISVFSFEFLI